jgi:protein-S-isoprenylcysteine O-methyltransferase Ste14
MSSPSVAALVLEIVGVTASWLFYLPLFLGGPRADAEATVPGDRTLIGFALQILALLILVGFHRPWPGPLSWNPIIEPTLAVVSLVVAVASVRLSQLARRELGTNWNFRAGLVDGHTLITTGPFRFVRHPLSLGFFGLVMATGLAVARAPAIPIAAIIFLIGTIVRIRTEDRVLSAAYGTEFELYKRKVSALLFLDL